MINLAGNKNCDETIREELILAQIPIETVQRSKGEVPYMLIGKLNGFTFTRAWYYWVVKGPMPVANALKLFDEPLGNRDIRVVGHAGNIKPEGRYPVTRWSPADNKMVIEQEEWDEAVGFYERHPNLKHHDDNFQKKCMPHANPESFPGYVMSYHVDSQLGLLRLSQEIQTLKDLPVFDDSL